MYKKFKIRLIYRSSDFVLKCMRKISPLDSSSKNLHLMGERLADGKYTDKRAYEKES